MGLVLVFDLDQTIIDSSDPYLFDRPNTPEGIALLKVRAKELLNTKLLNNVIKRAARLRGKKDASGNDLVSGIFLLTNNSSKIMVSAVDSVLRDEVAIMNPGGSIGRYMTSENIDPDTEGMPRQDYFFDSILMREHRMRTPAPQQQSPLKVLKDVSNMLGFIGVKLSDQELRENVFFFDDMDHPGMTLGDNYIKIVPPFNRTTTDQTNYTPVLQRLSELDGQPIQATKSLAKTPLTVSRTSFTPLRKFGRNRSGAMNFRVNKMELPEETTVRAKPTVQYTPPSTSGNSPYRPRPGESVKNFMIRMGENTSGGRRKTRLRTRKNRRNKSRKRLRK
jgi:hypothetical protein